MDTSSTERPADGPGNGEGRMGDLEAQWDQVQEGLAGYLSTIVDPDQADHLILELPGPDPGSAGCAPYAQFAGFGDGLMLRAEIAGDAHLAPQYRLSETGRETLRNLGWSSGQGGSDDHNWHVELPVGDAEVIAEHVVWVLRTQFAIAHPQLLTHRAWGPAAVGATALGLCATDDVPTETTGPPDPAGSSSAAQLHPDVARRPGDSDELRGWVATLLRAKYDVEPEVDDDGDFVLEHVGQPVWIRVSHEQPAVLIVARIVREVRSRRATAVELSIQNRDTLWVRWVLRERTVWQTLAIPAGPFVPAHLDAMLEIYLETLASTRDDLVLRTGGRPC